MRSSRRQRNLAPEASATMENVGGRVSNSNSALDARPSPSPLTLARVSLIVSARNISTVILYLPGPFLP